MPNPQFPNSKLSLKNFVSLLAIAGSLIGCSGGGGSSFSQGFACRENASPLPLELRGAEKVSLSRLEPTEGELGLPVGTLIYRSFEIYFQQPSTSTSLKTASFQARHARSGGEWRYSPICSRLSLSDALPVIEQELAGRVAIDPSGQLTFDSIRTLKMAFDFETGYRGELSPTSSSSDSFEKAFQLQSGSIRFYLLPNKDSGRTLYEIRSEASSGLDRAQIAVQFYHFAPGEEIPSEFLLP